jgi:hypothetical protein
VPAAPGSRPGVPAAPGSRPGAPAPPGSRPGAAPPLAARPFAAPAKPAAPQPQVEQLLEEDDDERTVMRNYPLPAAAFRAGAPAALRESDGAASASLPTPIAPRPDGAVEDDDSEDDDDERTVMRAAPVPLADDDDDDAKTVMREALDPAVLARMQSAPKPVVPAPAGSRPGAASPPAIASTEEDAGRSTPTTALPAETFAQRGPLPAAGAPAEAPPRHPFGDAPLDGGATVALPVDDFGAQPLRGDATVAFPAPSGAAAPNLGAPPPNAPLAPAPTPDPAPPQAPAATAQALAAPAAPPKKSAALVIVIAILALVVAGMVTFLVLHVHDASGAIARPMTHAWV